LHAVWTGGSELPAGPARDLVQFAVGRKRHRSQRLIDTPS